MSGMISHIVESPGVSAPYEGSPKFANACWGAALRGDSSECDETIRCAWSAPHFKNKLCSSCRANGLVVHASRLRALPPGGIEVFNKNCRSSGAWSQLKLLRHDVDLNFRLINQTRKCKNGPQLVLFEKATGIPDLGWAELPAHWAVNGWVRLLSAKGTLVPEHAMSLKALERQMDASQRAPPHQMTRGPNVGNGVGMDGGGAAYGRKRPRADAPPPFAYSEMAVEETQSPSTPPFVPAHVAPLMATSAMPPSLTMPASSLPEQQPQHVPPVGAAWSDAAVSVWGAQRPPHGVHGAHGHPAHHQTMGGQPPPLHPQQAHLAPPTVAQPHPQLAHHPHAPPGSHHVGYLPTSAPLAAPQPRPDGYSNSIAMQAAGAGVEIPRGCVYLPRGLRPGALPPGTAYADQQHQHQHATAVYAQHQHMLQQHQHQQRPPTAPMPTLYELSRPATSATSATPTLGMPTAAMATSPSGDAMQVEGGGRAMTASVDMSKMSEAGDAADALLGLCYGRRSALVSSTECA